MADYANILATIGIAFLGLALMSCGGSQSSAAGNSADSVFTALEQAIRNMDEESFRGQWHAEGYQSNLVGGSGLAGSRVYAQGSKGKWYLRPELNKSRTIEGVTIVPCDVWSWEKERSVDQIDVALVEDGGRLKVLGAGEDPEQVSALARRYARRESLAPPK